MTPYAAEQIKKSDIELFRKIREAVQQLPDLDLGEWDDGEKVVLSCHMLARAISKVFGIAYCDGYFHPYMQHSWNITPHKNIIDAYPIAIIGGPILMDGYYRNSSIYYTPAKFRCFRKYSDPVFRRSVRRLIAELKKYT